MFTFERKTGFSSIQTLVTEKFGQNSKKANSRKTND